MSASVTVLERRLREVLALEGDEAFNEVAAARAITGYCRGAMCARVPAVGGKCLSFEDYFRACYGRELDGSDVRAPKTGKKA